MAPSRGKRKVPLRPSAGASTTRRRRNNDGEDVPDVYRSMLAEADADTAQDHDHRPVKKRKVGNRSSLKDRRSSPVSPQSQATPVKTNNPSFNPPASSLQTVHDSSDSDSEFEFEDVHLDSPGEDVDDATIEDLSISVQPESSTRRSTPLQPRRKPASAVEKAQRLLVHKLHLLCLLSYCMFVNGRCNNPVAQTHLRKVLSAKTISYLNPKKIESQFQRNRSFMDGLQQAVDAFNADYRCSGAGLMRPQWSADGEAAKSFDSHPIDMAEFIAAAKDLEGSQDMGNQLFCAMLRSIGVDARIVSSLQVLPFASGAKPATPKKPAKEVVLATSAYDTPSRGTNASDAAMVGSSTIGKVPSARRRLGQPRLASGESHKPPTPKKPNLKPAPKLSYPVFWVEAFNEASQKWIPIDPVVTHTINKAPKLEPSASYEYNQLLYAIAFEKDGSARDVTRRYAKAYNAKTRRHRVEASSEGARWLKKVMRYLRRPAHLDRDQVEDAELAQHEAREGMPANVLDFKDHPYYALERHLKRHQVIHPRHEVGKVNAGTAAKPRMEPVFRRKDVLVCRSADKWYRIGREVKEGEQPLKHVPARNRRPKSVDEDEEDVALTTGLYSPQQTQLYIPPPVERGRIPKNIYGNLDIYAPSMVPAGGVHIRHALAQRASKLLRIDYSDAVIGFKFQGRNGTAIIEGVVIAQPFGAAVEAVIEGFEQEQIEEASRVRSLRALQVWKRFLTGLRIRERVVDGYGGGVTKEQETRKDEIEVISTLEEDLDDGPMITAGQYSIVELLAPTPKPAKAKKRKVVHDESDEEFVQVMDDEHDPDGLFRESTHQAGGFLPEHGHEAGGFLPDGDEGGGFLPDADDDGNGGGLVMPDEPDEGGGFLPDSHDEGGGFAMDDQGGVFVPADNDDGEGGGFLQKHDGEPGGGFLPNNENKEVEGFPPGAENTSTHVSPESIMKDDNATAPLQTEVAHAEDQDQDDEESLPLSKDDRSLPSHDSEDEEAEPDWLDSD